LIEINDAVQRGVQRLLHDDLILLQEIDFPQMLVWGLLILP